MRSCMVSMTHGWGARPEEVASCESAGSATTRQIGRHHRVERIHAMPQITATPVSVERRTGG